MSIFDFTDQLAVFTFLSILNTFQKILHGDAIDVQPSQLFGTDGQHLFFTELDDFF